MINFPIKGAGLTAATPTPEGFAPIITDGVRSIVTHLHFLEQTPNRDQIASEIAYLLRTAAEIGFEQGIHSIRVALGVSK